MQKCLSLEVVIGDSQHEFYVPHCQSALSHPGIYMAGEVAESLVREMEGFSYLTIADMRLMSGSDPLLESVACTNSRVKAGCRAYPAGSLTAILQPQDHMSELIVLILSVIEELIDFALDITAAPHSPLTEGRVVHATIGLPRRGKVTPGMGAVQSAETPGRRHFQYLVAR